MLIINFKNLISVISNLYLFKLIYKLILQNLVKILLTYLLYSFLSFKKNKDIININVIKIV